MVDSEDVVRDYLLSVPAVTAITGTRIYIGTNLPDTYKPAAGAAILLKVRGGSPDYSGAIMQPSIQFQCYAATGLEARRCARALYDALHNAASGQIMQARCETLPQMLAEPETNPPWYFALSFYRVHIRNT